MTDKCLHMIVKPRKGDKINGGGSYVSLGNMSICTLVNKECLLAQTGRCQVEGMNEDILKGALKDMNVIFRPRQTGKTTDLIKRAAEIGGIIVTNTIPDAVNVAKLAAEMGTKIRKPISIRQFNITVGEILREKVPVLVDDAEYILQYLMNMSLAGGKINIDTITVTNEKAEAEKRPETEHGHTQSSGQLPGQLSLGDSAVPEAPASEQSPPEENKTGRKRSGKQQTA